MEKELKIGIVGAGGIVKDRHLPGLREIPGVAITAVCNSTPESAEKFLSKEGLEADIEKNWSDLVAREDLDIVWVGATPYLHEPVTVAALEAGKHVFCQARMARNLGEALQMFRASEARPDLVTMLCPPPFGLAIDAFVKRLLAEQPIGTMNRFCLKNLSGVFRDGNAPIHWRQDESISGYNVLALGIHVEILQRWFGDIRALSASGEFLHPERHGRAMEIPDQIDVIAEFESGILGSLHLSGVHDGDACCTLEIEGAEGALKVDLDADTVEMLSNGRESRPLHPDPETLRPWRVEADFIDAVRAPEKPRPHPDFSDGIAYMRVVEAAYMARTTGIRQTLKVPNSAPVEGV